MIEFLKPERNPEVDVVYGSAELYNEYQGDLTQEMFTKVHVAFFEMVKKYVLSGGAFFCPLFRIKIKRKFYDPTKNYIDFYKTKLHKAAGGKGVIFKDETFIDTINIHKNMQYSHIAPYKIHIPRNGWILEIPKYREIRELSGAHDIT